MMAKSVKLTSGHSMPLFGLGTFRLTENQSIVHCLDAALDSGYRLIDTAQFYENEADIGQSLIDLLPKHGLERKDIFITTKLHTSHMSKDEVRPMVEQSLINLKTDYIDLFLIHYPKPAGVDDPDAIRKARRECWLEMEKLHSEGKLRSIGVANYEIRHLDEMSNYATIQPCVNQVEFHPHSCRRDFYNEHEKRNIHLQAFASLARNDPAMMNEPLLIQMAEKYHAPVAHILLAWPLAMGICIIPKSSNPDRVRENYKAIHLKLNHEDVEKIWSLHKDAHYTYAVPWKVP